MQLLVRPANNDDIEFITAIHQTAFPRQHHSRQWISATLSAYPRYLVYVIQIISSNNDMTQIAGYIFWSQKSGFRMAAVIELDQMAINPEYQNQGLGKTLIKQSLKLIKLHFQSTGQYIKTILVSTADNNPAKYMYLNTLNASVVATIAGLYTNPEIILKSDASGLDFLDH